MSGPGVTLIYNPDLEDPKTLIETFVVRLEELADILGDLRRTDASRQHHLVVGQRGMGKSTLLHRIAYAIDDEAELSNRWVPLLYPEEQYNVGRLTDLLENSVDAYAARLEKRGLEEDAKKLDEAVLALPADDEARTRALLSMLGDLSKAEKRGFVLLIDNIDVVLSRLSETEQWRLREILQGEDWLIVVGASTVMAEVTWNYGAPFYDFFKVHTLHGLDLEQTRHLFDKLATLRNDTRVKDVLREAPARVRALHRLTGGNPRTVVLLFTVLSRNALSDIDDDLQGLLDLSTPLYKARLEALPPQQQRIVDTIALKWAPMTAREVADDRREDINDVSSQISRLTRDGVLEEVVLPDTAKRGYQIGERLFNIWFLMRAGRRQRRQLVWLVHFLREFYTAEELESLARGEGQRRLGECGSGINARRVRALIAMGDAVENEALRHGIHVGVLAMAAQIENVQRSRELLGELFDLEGEDRALAPEAERMATLQRVHEKIKALPKVPEGYTRESLWSFLGGTPYFSATEKERAANRLRTDPDGALLELRSIEEWEATISSAPLIGAALFAGYRDAVRQGKIAGPDDLEGARGCQEVEPHTALVLMPLLWKIATATSLQDLVTVVPFLRYAPDENLWLCWFDAASNLSGSTDPNNGERTEMGSALDAAGFATEFARALGDTQRIPEALGTQLLSITTSDSTFSRFIAPTAVRTLERLMAIYGERAEWHSLLGGIRIRTGPYDRAEIAFRRARDLAPDVALNWYLHGLVLAIDLERHDEAYAALMKAAALGKVDPTLLATALMCARNPAQREEVRVHYATIRDSITSSPAESYDRVRFADLAMTFGEPTLALNAIRPYLEKHRETLASSWSDGDLVPFIHAALTAGQASPLVQLLEDVGLADPWRPLAEALRCLAARDSSHLARLPVEIRDATVDVLASLDPTFKIRTPQELRARKPRRKAR